MADSGGFFLPIYALNWLGMHGFELAPQELLQQSLSGDEQHLSLETDERYLDPYEEEEEELDPRYDGTYMGQLLFVKRQSYASDAVSIADIIIQQDGSPRRPTCSMPREYATLNTSKRSMGDCAWLQYASGSPVSLPPRLGNGQMRNIGRVHCTNVVVGMELLRQHGFTTREARIEAFLTRAQTLTSDGFYNNSTMVFSRPLYESSDEQPLLPMSDGDLIRQQLFHDWVQEPTHHDFRWRRVPRRPPVQP